MKIYKAGDANTISQKAVDELCAINAFAKAELTESQVYIFSVVLCDNEVDRDFEKFSDGALYELSELFVGKTGIFDHDWKTANQTARIYRTQVVTLEGEKNSLGEPYRVLKGYAYMLRGDKNADLIAEIEAGIKKEVSIGCSAVRRVCSICGDESRPGGCEHVLGREYEGKLCFHELSNISDAYEWSFVAVPAQRGAGVVKGFGRRGTLKGFVQGSTGMHFAAEFEALEKDAVLGREYRGALQNEVLRLGLLYDRKFYEALLESTKFMGADELKKLQEVFKKKLEDKFPPRTQLPGREKMVSFEEDEYLV